MSNPVTIKPNPNTPSIQQVQANVPSLTAILQTLRQIVQSLCGQSGSVTARAVTFDDLIALGLITVTNAKAAPSANVTANLTLTDGTVIIRNVDNLIISGGTLTGNSNYTTLTL